MDIKFLRLRLDESRGAVVAFPPVSTRPNWNDAVDRLTLSAKECLDDLDDFEQEIWLTGSPERLERIAGLLREIEVMAATIHRTAIDRANELTRLQTGA